MRRDLEAVALLDPSPDLDAAPEHLDAELRATWYAIVRAAPDVLRAQDALIVELAARSIVAARAAPPERAERRRLIRQAYRLLGDCLVPMPARRALLFGHRH